MNLLIMGGLIVIAAAAILGAVLLSISEQRAEKAHANAEAAVATNTRSPASSAAHQGVPTSRTAPIKHSIPVPTERAYATAGDDQQLSTLNGQFHELASELRTLYQHAWELEQHLRVLTEAVDRIEQSQAAHFSIAEEARVHSPGDGSQL
ncbi:MAG TPA: hypothetical protein VKV20_09670 [Ktedonobacteraceae bacterium]|jgi:uncharacterized protein HemX|nr:hypothetical protein [Ktedonobacteraceae bacterium]